MKRNLKIIESVLSLVCACLLLASTIFAWVSLRPTGELQEFVVNAGEYRLGIVFELRKRNQFGTGNFTEYRTKAEIEALFQNAVPGDSYDFRLTVTNMSSFPIAADVRLTDITNVNENEGFDMRNVFYLDGGKVYLNGEARDLPVISTEPESAHGQELNLFRLNNLMDGSGGINLLSDVPMDLEETAIIEFTLTYDHTTSHLFYQEGVLNIDAIFIHYD